MWLCSRMRNLVVRARTLRKLNVHGFILKRNIQGWPRQTLTAEIHIDLECEKRAEISSFQRRMGRWSPAVTQERLSGSTELIYVQMLRESGVWTPDSKDERADEWNPFLGAHLEWAALIYHSNILKTKNTSWNYSLNSHFSFDILLLQRS